MWYVRHWVVQIELLPFKSTLELTYFEFIPFESMFGWTYFYLLNPYGEWHILSLCFFRVWIDIFFTCWIYNWTDIFWAFILWIHRMTHFEFWIFIWIDIFLHVESIFELNFFELISFESIVGLIMYSKWFCLYRLNPCLDWYILSVYLLNTCFDWLIFVFYSSF